jgi:hypothetical protein
MEGASDLQAIDSGRGHKGTVEQRFIAPVFVRRGGRILLDAVQSFAEICRGCANLRNH